MKLDLTPVKPGYVTPTFGGDDNAPMAPELQQRLRRPMLLGVAIIGVCVVGLGLWASFSKLATGVPAAGEVRVDSQRKTLRRKDAGTVKAVLVHEGQKVSANQPLILFNDVEPRAAVDVLQAQYDTNLAQKARFQAEATGRAVMEIPAELNARASDPRVATLIHDQQFLFTTRQQLMQSQTAVLTQRIEQQLTQVQGAQAQLDSVNEQVRLTEEELQGYRKLNEQGFAPKTLILRYERSQAELAGRKGQLISEIARLKQQMGETRLQLASVRDERESQSAEGLRDAEARLVDVIPRLTAAREALQGATLRSPVDGYVFNLTQFTVGGVVGGGEVMLDVVPSETPLTVTAMVKPEDVDEIRVGMPSKVRLTGLNQRFNDALDGTVSVVSADRITNDKTGQAFYRVDVRIAPDQLARLKKGVRMTQGMPAMVQFVTGQRSVMSFLISPITSTLEDAFREE